MGIFLADRANLQRKRLHDRIQNRLSGEFTAVRRRRAKAREPGPYRVVADVAPRQFLDDERYPATTARLEIGFQLQPKESQEHYWINWIEPKRSLLVGWHQDDTHDDLGPVHLQVNDGSRAVAHESAVFVESHPLDVVERRLGSLPELFMQLNGRKDGPLGLILLPL